MTPARAITISLTCAGLLASATLVSGSTAPAHPAHHAPTR
jgi:hypothetical protein